MQTQIATMRHGNAVLAVVLLTGLFQGLTLVSFPALSGLLKTALGLSDTAYGSIFLPQVILTALSAVFGGLLIRRLGLAMLLRLSLVANGLSQLGLLAGVTVGGDAGYILIIMGTAMLGLGFGISAAPLNQYPVVFFPDKPDSALAALHTLLGTGLAMGPVAAGFAMKSGHWPIFPATLVVLAALLMVWSLCVGFPRATGDEAPRHTSDGKMVGSAAFWMLMAVGVIYAFCEGLFSNWAVIFLQEDKHIHPEMAGFALSAFWAVLAAGRLLTVWLVLRWQAKAVWLGFPLLMACAFVVLPRVETGAAGIAAYAFAGLACSGFFPLTVGRASAKFPQFQAKVASFMVASLMLGVGAGSFVSGSLRAFWPLSAIFELATLLPLLVFGLGLLSLYAGRKKNSRMTNQQSLQVLSGHVQQMISCPACGGDNAPDAIFCANDACHKALGEFKYVLEELRAEKNALERLADHVTLFVSRPGFLILHMVWFIAWVLLNSDYFDFLQRFDDFPYDFLSIILAVEAIFITGFLLISQNHQTAYSEKRAELDYEINIRSYRKLVELERRLDDLYSARQDQSV